MCDCSRGPVSTMPGSKHRVPLGTKCDQHGDREAILRIQGETDSMGCEYIDMCVECAEAYNQSLKDPNAGYCDWCNHFATERLKTRDYDEGSSGPIYDVCIPCRKAASQRASEELAEIADDYPILEDDWPDQPEILDIDHIAIDV